MELDCERERWRLGRALICGTPIWEAMCGASEKSSGGRGAEVVVLAEVRCELSPGDNPARRSTMVDIGSGNNLR